MIPPKIFLSNLVSFNIHHTSKEVFVNKYIKENSLEICHHAQNYILNNNNFNLSQHPLETKTKANSLQTTIILNITNAFIHSPKEQRQNSLLVIHLNVTILIRIFKIK